MQEVLQDFLQNYCSLKGDSIVLTSLHKKRKAQAVKNPRGGVGRRTIFLKRLQEACFHKKTCQKVAAPFQTVEKAICLIIFASYVCILADARSQRVEKVVFTTFSTR